MGIKLKEANEQKEKKYMRDMEKGEIAVILDVLYSNEIIQYIGSFNDFHYWVKIGKDSMFTRPSDLLFNMNYEIRILPPGTELVIT